MKTRVTVKLQDVNFKGQFIEMNMNEYVDFINEQAGLLGIATPLIELEPIKSREFNIVMPKGIGMTASKTFMDEFFKELNKENKRNKGGTF